jgi:thioredoxin 1
MIANFSTLRYQKEFQIFSKEFFMLDLTDKNFSEELEKSKLPMIIDFWATWCGPCKVLHMVLEEIEKELEGKLIVARVEVDTNPKLSEFNDVLSIPMILFIKEGKTVGRHTGLLTKKQLMEKIATYLN